MPEKKSPRPFNLEKSQYRWLRGWGIRKLKAGVAHEAARYKDYQCKTRSFATLLYKVAASQGYKVTLCVFEKQDRVVFCFFKEDDLLKPNLHAYTVVRKMRDQENR